MDMYVDLILQKHVSLYIFEIKWSLVQCIPYNWRVIFDVSVLANLQATLTHIILHCLASNNDCSSAGNVALEVVGMWPWFLWDAYVCVSFLQNKGFVKVGHMFMD